MDFYANMQYLEKFLSLEETPCSMKFTSGTYMCFEMSGLFGCGMYCFLHSIVCCVCRKTNYVDILNSSSFLSPLSTLWLGYKQNIVQLKRSKIYIRIRHLLWQKVIDFQQHSCMTFLCKTVKIYSILNGFRSFIVLYIYIAMFMISIDLLMLSNTEIQNINICRWKNKWDRIPLSSCENFAKIF